jgi:alpha-tubulin suppressor-like RCC1 family protein
VVGGVELQGKIRDLFAGGTHSCAILEPNTLVCWGGNDQGQLGLGDRMARSTPTRVSGISARAMQGAAGDYHTCVYLDTDDVACWGYGFYGALGTGRTDDELTPRVVVVPND